MNIGAVIGGGFRLVREKPAAVAVWGLLYMLAVIAMTFLMRPLMQAQMQAGGGNLHAAFADIGAMIGRMVLFVLLFFILYVILYAASQRAVLQPERQNFFYLRLGMDELRLLALAIIFVIGFYAAVLVLTVIMSLLIGLLAAATGSFGVAAGLALVEFLVILVFAVGFFTRFSLAFPLTMLRGKIIIGESWRITRGRFWTLFTAFLVLFLMLLLLWAAVSLVTSGAYFAQLAKSGLDPVAMQQAQQQQMARQFGGISAIQVIGWILGGAVGGLSIAIWGGAVATAARQLTFDPDEIAETFA
ncbi:MAG: hypothetical protein QOH81_3210 [Sphingomonadales bacterium]|jgi:hypothetical protein|nr:hypothetical protein [Sphingomonadales bacterium]